MVDLPGRRVTIRKQILFGLAGLSFVFLSTLLVTPLFDLTRYQLSVGQPAPRKVVARLKFQVEDRESAEALRIAQILSITPRFLRDPGVENQVMAEVRESFESLKRAAHPSGRPAEFPSWLDETVAQEALKLTDRDWADIERAARSLIHEFMAEKGILHDASAAAAEFDLHRHRMHEIQFDSDGDTRPPLLIRRPPDLIDMKGMAGYLESSVSVIYPNLPAARLLSAVLKQAIKANQVFDRDHFRHEVERVQVKIKPVFQMYAPGNVIVRENQIVTESHLAAIREMQKADRTRLIVTGVAAFALLSLFTLIMLQYLRVYQPERLVDTNWMWFIALMFLFMLGLARLIWTLTDSRLAVAFALPVPAYAMLLTIFYRPRVAMLSSPFLGVSIALLYGCNYQLMLVHTVTSIVSVFAVRQTRTMGDIVKAGIFLAFVSPVTVLASHFVLIDFAHITQTRELLIATAVAFGSGLLLVPFLTFGLIHFIPILFSLPSDFKILELSDLNHPLLRQMLLSAPGSYQHSQTVSILSEAACESIGANSLLARVGSYYHDVGKTKKPEYFTENQKLIIDEKGDVIGKETKDIKPSLYASVLKTHVKMGVDLAREHRLPRIIIDFIEQHHGTSLMKSLYDAALNQSTEEDIAERESFIYPGPKPKYRETAVVMLADTVEAAVRSLESPTPHRIEEEVHRLIQSKVSDGQLDDCTLTLKDLKKIEEAFTRVLSSMYHTRIAYPTDDELKRKDKEKHRGET
ncbi:MAG: hypothetical protein A3G34_04370 [Candidatus Lindowbacteria bacterium RIFCSPLOWO2_12_FULL_62_27]|nr:MAG: hypothetical protein A3G34_04370 [Candidatus Lindowbacteria bacterium RIFCSPLOWO2_12_FULL_62_27]